LVIVWRLHYEPLRIEGLPKSRRERIVWIAFESIAGAIALVSAATIWVPDTITTMRVLTACMFALYQLAFLAFFWTSIIELRRAVRLRRQQLHQQTDE
jgi:hypothetical protein